MIETVSSPEFRSVVPEAAIVPELLLRTPRLEDGPAIHDLIARCPPLDRNSRYCNLLQATHFAGTSIVAVAADGALVGAVTGYVRPDAPDTLFVWQVAVASVARGQRLAPRMLHALVARPASAAVRWMETSITADNAASWAAFRAFARAMGAGIMQRAWLSRQTHLGGAQDDEILLRIGPLEPATLARSDVDHAAALLSSNCSSTTP